ncbi:hypothetical protein BRYFOR_05385 [Marvinbryantia formatexigens DSM 14469]|uniref:TIGR01906 family protein n=1 Tax=Marvinbryantia formatexigens DSM 14469 TaxID=478749 RepID=C6L9U5_9FIRM|nr:TIGR01906 family membrane protein [Marvinbryantia formatexigens]EET62352.1 hypothetical protein BRYFOR_05385 [Marvinbryantia formatexigens DSM 14469]UWO25093.1 TIGR01906 family membrane protein [Marvinbryantia formatexigens DSM 14469]SDG95144.1 integral membrane protein TIGR01906 [Marvinbryantia formatexigens]
MLKKIIEIILVPVTMLFLISAAVYLTLACRPLYYFDIQYLEIAEESGYSEAEIRENYDVLIDYNLSPRQDKLEFPTLPMSREGEIHFREVKAIFQLFLWALVVSIPVLIIAGIWFYRNKWEPVFLKWAGMLTPLFILLVGLLIAADWDRAFVLFHELVFRNDYWLFDPATDPVITILPDTYFLHCAVLILVLIAAGSAISVFIWKKCAKAAGGRHGRLPKTRRKGSGRNEKTL